MQDSTQHRDDAAVLKHAQFVADTGFIETCIKLRKQCSIEKYTNAVNERSCIS